MSNSDFEEYKHLWEEDLDQYVLTVEDLSSDDLTAHGMLLNKELGMMLIIEDNDIAIQVIKKMLEAGVEVLDHAPPEYDWKPHKRKVRTFSEAEMMKYFGRTWKYPEPEKLEDFKHLWEEELDQHTLIKMLQPGEYVISDSQLEHAVTIQENAVYQEVVKKMLEAGVKVVDHLPRKQAWLRKRNRLASTKSKKKNSSWQYPFGDSQLRSRLYNPMILSRFLQPRLPANSA